MADVGQPLPDWGRYDAVAEAYEQFVEANAYAALARDLVAALTPPPGGAVLDAGCGTGVSVLAAQEAVGTGGLVVGLDVSLAMLRQASARSDALLVAGAVSALPFPDRLFDGVAASLVLSHSESYQATLREMVRVLKGGGCLGVTTGARKESAPNAIYQVWLETAESAVGGDTLREASRRVLPYEEWLTDAAHVGTALLGAGLEGVKVHQREYHVTMATDDYVAMLDVFLYGRLLRQNLDPARWQQFRQTVTEKVHRRGVTRVEYTARFHLGVGTKPE